VIAVIVVTVAATLIVNEFTDLCPWLATRLVRWSALRRYRNDPRRASTRAEEQAALIAARPGSLLKLLTALCFTAAAVFDSSRTPSPHFVDLTAATAFWHVLDRALIQIPQTSLAVGDTLTIPEFALGDHLFDCQACRRRLWLSHPGAMLLHRRSLRQFLSSGLGWSIIRGRSDTPMQPHRGLKELPRRDG
jgi:hypothetical protein